MRFRMKAPFEDATLLAPKIRAYWDLCRPFTLFAPAIGGILFGAMAILADPDIALSWATGKLIGYGAVTMVLLNAGSNSINQAADVVGDRINKPYRPVPAGMVTVKEAYSVGVILWFLAITRAMLISWTFLGLTLGVLLCAYLYSEGPRLKRVYILNNLTLAASRGFLGPLAAWSVIGSPADPRILAIGSVFAVYVFGSSVFKDLPDVPGDQKEGVRNFATQHGPKKATLIALVFMLATHLLVALYVAIGLFPPVVHWYHVFILITLYIGESTWTEHDPESVVENRRSWLLMYLQMMLMMVFFTFTFLGS